MKCKECGDETGFGEMCQACADLALDEQIELDESLDYEDWEGPE